MSNTELKPCPFCGGEVKIYADNHNKVMISCDNCNMYFGIELEIGCELEEGWKATHNSKEEAIKYWNTRKPMDNIVAELECRENFYHNCALGEVMKNGQTLDAESFLGKKNAYTDAIDIVRGGVE